MADIQIIDEGNIIEIIQGRDLTVVLPVQNGIEIEQYKFIQLADTPKSYEDAAGKTLRVNTEGNAIVFDKTYSSFLDLTDTPRTYENSAGQIVAVNSSGTGLRFINYSSGDINIENFTQLADVPNTYADKANYLVAVNNNADGLTFITKDDLLPTQANVKPGSYKYPVVVINNKGIITSIKEGSPFEFDPFKENRLLIGDGTTTPAQLSEGRAHQVLGTSITDTPEWTFLDRLISPEGKPLLIMDDESEDDSSTLRILNSKEKVILQPSNKQTIILGNSNDTQISGNLIIPDGSMLQGLGGLKIDPYSGTVGIEGVSADNYSGRIKDNDFITKNWYEKQQGSVTRVSSMIRTSDIDITSNTVTFPLPAGCRVMEVNFIMVNQFNNEAALQITNNQGDILFNSSDSPYLTEDFKVFLNQQSNTSSYKINIKIQNYTYGHGSVFMSYFEGIY